METLGGGIAIVISLNRPAQDFSPSTPSYRTHFIFSPQVMANVKTANGTTDIHVAEMKYIYPEMTVDTDFLIVGAGPAGASLGCFLGKYGE